jgi:hypothetical protein
LVELEGKGPAVIPPLQVAEAVLVLKRPLNNKGSRIMILLFMVSVFKRNYHF